MSGEDGEVGDVGEVGATPPARFRRSRLLVAGLLVVAALLGGGGALLAAGGGGSGSAAGVSVAEAWTAPNLGVTAVYLTIDNGGEDDRLVGAATDVAGAASLMGGEAGLTHAASDDAGTEPVGLALPEGTTVLEPGARHLMLEGVTGELQPGDGFPLRLEFERAGTIEVQVEVVSWDEAVERSG
jgi:copper(I)-binding protein